MTEPTKTTPSRIHIRKVTAEAFRAFKDKQSTGQLPDTGLVAIRGTNKNTGGSSGAGKSSVSHIISYVLGYSPFSANKQQSWLTKTPMQAELELDTPQGLAIIKRGKETSIKVGDEEVVKGSVKAVDARIEKLFGMPIDLLSVLTDRKQKQPGLFLSMDDKSKKSFLSKLLGLEELEKVIATANENAKKHFLVAERHDSAIKALSEVIKAPEPFDEDEFTIYIEGESFAVQQITVAISQAEYKVKEAEVDLRRAEKSHGDFREKLRLESEEIKKDAVAEVQAFDEHIKQVVTTRPPRPNPNAFTPEIAQWVAAKDNCNARIRNLIEADEKEKNEIRIELATKRQFAAKLRMAIQSKPALEAELNKITKETEGINACTCPTCKQQWVAEEGRLAALMKRSSEIGVELTQLNKMSGELQALVTAIATLELQLEQRPGPNTEELRIALQRITTTIATEEQKIKEAAKLWDAQMNAEDSGFKAKRSEIYERRSKEKASYFQTLQSQIDRDGAKVRELEGAVIYAKNVHYNLKDALAKFNTQLATAKATYQAQKKAFDDGTSRLAAQRLEFETSQRLAHSEQDFALTTKAFLGAVFDEVLIEIAEEANELLRALPNVATTTINFSSEKVTGSGDVKQEIKPVIMKSGQVIDYEANLSGGQGTSVELSVDLALGAVIGRRTGQRPGWLVLDEAFEGHDLPVKEACLEILKKASGQCAIYVVDHASEVKEYFDTFIDVESEDDVSSIIQR